MQPETSVREHHPVDGLPASLIRLNGKTVAVIDLMKKAGLNRERKKRLEGRIGKTSEPPEGDLSVMTKTDWNVLRYFMVGTARFSIFWRVMRFPHAVVGTERYALAIDIQLLDAFDATWQVLALNEEILCASCAAWPDIRNGIAKALNARAEDLPLGLFMLWPRLVEELRRWDELDALQQQRVSHAIFALSSVGRTHWFIDEALAICPRLTAELGPNSRALSTDRVEGGNKEGSPEECIARSDSESEPSSAAAEQESGWTALMARLNAIVDELREHPTGETIEDLVRLSQELGRFSTILPARNLPTIEAFAVRRIALMAYLRSLASQDAFGWLDEELIAQINARWGLAANASVDEAQLISLTSDAAEASLRSSVAAEDYLNTVEIVIESTRETRDLEAAVGAIQGFAGGARLRRQHVEAKKKLAEAENAQIARQEMLVDAASPFAEPFDYSVEYVAMLHGSSSCAEEDVAPSNEVDEAAIALDTTATTEIDPVGAAAVNMTDRNTVALSSVAEQVPRSESDTIALAMAPVVAMTDSVGNAHAEYSAEAGRICHPIWQLVASGEIGLAYHAARWVEEVHQGVRVPLPDLLAAAAYSEELMLSDGALQAALAARYANLVVDDFAVGTPATWHAAVNLLLAAATLRPMILAPGCGAEALADYLHQDGHYSALYELVQKLRSLSARLVGFSIEPAVLRRARGETATRADIEILQRTAGDWLRTQAPAYTIRFAPATAVWKQWIRPGGEIETLVSPVIHSKIGQAERVRNQLEKLSNEHQIHRLIHDTDRKVIKRLRGDDIHASALDHLIRLAYEAMGLAKSWLGLVDLLGGKGDRLRELLEEVNAVLRDSTARVEDELHRIPDHDPWNLIAGSQAQVSRALRGLLALFDSATVLHDIERSPAEVLGRPLLKVAGLPINEQWTMELEAGSALEQLSETCGALASAEVVLRDRVERGDLLGAELMIGTGLVDAGAVQLRAERDKWRSVLHREVIDCRRDVEVGSAYGYLPDAERSEIETHLARIEAQLDDERRFDVIMDQLKQMRGRVANRREESKRKVLVAIQDLSLSDDMQPGLEEVKKALKEGDIATANELIHWLQQGKPMPADLDEDTQEGFEAFFPTSILPINRWLEDKRRDVIETSLRDGSVIPGLEGRHSDNAQRMRAAEMFACWSDIKARNHVDERLLGRLLTGLGLTVRSLNSVERAADREVFALESTHLDDRHVCVLPMYGSVAAGRYRVICVRGRPTEDELLQSIGDASLNRPTILLYFGRLIEKKWRELSRIAKSKRRSFLYLDETLLIYLCGAGGSRLRAWFDTAMPFSYASPYDATAGLVPPEMFYGRSMELEAVRGLNGRCFIYGGRQLGKTALLKRAEQSFHEPERHHYARWIDLRAEGIGVSLAASEIWVTLHERFKEMRIIDAKSTSPTPGKKQGAERVIGAIRDFLVANHDRRVLLLLDEADRFFEQDSKSDFEETRRLKQLMDDTKRRFKVVFAGLHNVLRMTEHPNHPLAHFGEPIEIGPLRDGDEVKEAANLIRKPMAAAGFAFESRSLVIRILAQTNYYPSLIQLYCSHLLRHMLSQVTGTRGARPGPRYLVTSTDIEQVYSSDALRDEIRAKFRLTLQLDPRYEVLAYAMALALLRGDYSQSEGLPWQTIRQAGAMHWWAEGFRDTSELDFRVLLDEMVGLGVLRPLTGARYVLRNPNVLLLLGTRDEIETVLNKDREPAVEFESASFRPPMRPPSRKSARNVFTYQQLSKLLQRKNSITVVTGTQAAGIDKVITDLQDYLDSGTGLQVIANCADRQSFARALQAKLNDRPQDQVSVFVVPDSMPWTDLWIQEAHSRLQSLRSEHRFASVIFVAEPATLWRLLRDGEPLDGGELPWMSLLHWNDEFLRHWLEECQLPLEQEERRRLASATGLWPALISNIAGDCTELRAFKDRLKTASDDWPLDTTDGSTMWRPRLGLDVGGPERVLEVLSDWKEAVTADELAELGDLPVELVTTSLRWAELLGLARREGVRFWVADPIVARVLTGKGS